MTPSSPPNPNQTIFLCGRNKKGKNVGISVNLAGVNTGFEVLPAGTYVVRVSSGELKESGENAKNPGSQYISWTLTVDEGEYEGRKLFTNTSLLPHALFGLKGLLVASGVYTASDLEKELDFEIDEVIGSVMLASVKVKPKTDQYDESNTIKSFKPYDADEATGSDESDLLP